MELGVNRRQLFFKNIGLSLRRAFRDKRALQRLLAMVGLIVYSVYLALNLLNPGTIMLLVPAILLMLMIRRAHKRDDQVFLKLTDEHRSSAGGEFREHRRRLAELALRTAVVVDRAGGEAYVKGNTLAADAAGVFRRRSLDVARNYGLLEGFSDEMRQLLTSPEGSWEWPQILLSARETEDVRVLRWVLGMDQVLAPLEFAVPMDFRAVVEITTTPQKIMEGNVCIPPWDLRPARDAARTLMMRCIAEGVKRGIVEESDEALRGEYLHYAELHAGRQSEDFLLGSVIVSDAKEEQVQQATLVAYRRQLVLAAIIEYLGSPSDAPIHVTPVESAIAKTEQD
jgi:hypothetical protein